MFKHFKWQSPILGIDLSCSPIKIIEISQASGQFFIEHYGITPIPSLVFNEDQLQDTSAIIDALKTTVRASLFQSNRAVLVLPDTFVFKKMLHLPDILNEEEIEEFIKMEAEEYFSYPAEQINFDFKVLSPSNEYSDRVEVLSVAVKIGPLKDLIDLITLTGLKAKIITIESEMSASMGFDSLSLIPLNKKLNKEFFYQNSSQFTIAYAAAIEGYKEKQTVLNLLPWREKKRIHEKKCLKIFLIVSLAILVSSLFGSHLYIYQRITSQNIRNQLLQKEIVFLEQQTKKINQLKQTGSKLLTKIAVFYKAKYTLSSVLHFFDVLIKIMPQGVHLSQLQGAPKGLSVQGYARSGTEISLLMNKIKHNDWFKNPVLLEIKKAHAADFSFINEFKLSLNFKEVHL